MSGRVTRGNVTEGETNNVTQLRVTHYRKILEVAKK